MVTFPYSIQLRSEAEQL